MKNNGISFSEAKIRIKKLRAETERYRNAYHTEDRSLISDAALDSLKKELFDLEEKYPSLITPDSPTQRVAGKPLPAFKKVRHITPMTSFNDGFNENDIREWFARLKKYLGEEAEPEFYCELKIDGLAIELVYEDGVLVQGSTRGDGIIGEDVTQNLKTVEAIPLRLKVESCKPKVPNFEGLKAPKKLTVRGEVFLTKKEFQRINKEQEQKGEKPYANPRNVAAGSIRQLDPKITAGRRLDSFIYDIVLPAEDSARAGLPKHSEEHNVLRDLGFKTNPHNKLVRSLKEVFAFRNYWEKHREGLDYEIDGIVAAINDNRVFERAGIVGKAPRGAIAYKFSSREATTIVRDIRAQIGRTGVLTPVAELAPVLVGGVTITHATLHNAGEIERLGVRIHDTVIVSRAGDVIPKITAVLKNLRIGREKLFKMPARCPIDNSPVSREGALYRCSDVSCGARRKELLYHFVSRRAFDIRGLGQKIIDRFLDEGLITDAADIFALEAGDIAVLDGFGEKSAENIAREVGKKKIITLPRFLYALGILHIGEETARLLAEEAGKKTKDKRQKISPLDILRVFSDFSPENLQEIPDVGPKVAESIYKWFHNKKNIGFLEKLERAGVRIEDKGQKTKNEEKLAGKIFVFTGELEKMTRDEAKDRTRVLGGEVSESVSGKTSFLIAGKNPGSKHKKALSLGIPVLNEEEFLKMAGS